MNMTKKARKAKRTETPAAAPWTSIYTKVPRDLAARIHAEVERLGYPHTMASVISAALAERFPATPSAATPSEGSAS